MRSLVFCYAPEDETAAREIGASIELNLPFEVAYTEGAIGPDFDIFEAVERGLSADAALVLLSSHSMPKVWKRGTWEALFFTKPEEFGALLGCVQLDDCKFPSLLTREKFFDARRGVSAAARGIRRWLLRPEITVVPAVETPALEIADQPGVAVGISDADALAFSAAHFLDFESMHSFDFSGRSHAGILGDIGQSLDLRLPGTLAQNRESLSAWCGQHRCLFVFGNVAAENREFLWFGGRVSVIFTCDSPARKRCREGEILATFLSAPRDERRCSAIFSDALFYLPSLLDRDYEQGLRLAWAVVSSLKLAQRFAEAVEVLASMEQAARLRDDERSLSRIEWEQSWTSDSSEAGDDFILPTAGPDVVQLSLFR